MCVCVCVCVFGVAIVHLQVFFVVFFVCLLFFCHFQNCLFLGSIKILVFFFCFFLSPDVRGLLKWVRPPVCPSVRRHNEMDSLWTQLLLQFLTDLF